MQYTKMTPGTLYRCDNHLYCLKAGKYYWLAYDHFAQQYIPDWKQQTESDMDHLDLSLVTVKNLTPGIRVIRDSRGRPIRFQVLTYGSQ